MPPGQGSLGPQTEALTGKLAVRISEGPDEEPTSLEADAAVLYSLGPGQINEVIVEPRINQPNSFSCGFSAFESKTRKSPIIQGRRRGSRSTGRRM